MAVMLLMFYQYSRYATNLKLIWPLYNINVKCKNVKTILMSCKNNNKADLHQMFLVNREFLEYILYSLDGKPNRVQGNITYIQARGMINLRKHQNSSSGILFPLD